MAAVYRDRLSLCEKMIRPSSLPGARAPRVSTFTVALPLTVRHASTARAAAAVTTAPTPACRRPPPRLDEGQNMRAYADTAAP